MDKKTDPDLSEMKSVLLKAIRLSQEINQPELSQKAMALYLAILQVESFLDEEIRSIALKACLTTRDKGQMEAGD